MGSYDHNMIICGSGIIVCGRGDILTPLLSETADSDPIRSSSPFLGSSAPPRILALRGYGFQLSLRRDLERLLPLPRAVNSLDLFFIIGYHIASTEN